MSYIVSSLTKRQKLEASSIWACKKQNEYQPFEIVPDDVLAYGLVPFLSPEFLFFATVCKRFYEAYVKARHQEGHDAKSTSFKEVATSCNRIMMWYKAEA